MVPKGIFEPKREEVTGGWRKFHNEELCCNSWLMLFE
jgi:hypothetical protein